MKPLHRLLALEPTERRLLLEAALVVTMVRLGLAAAGFPAVRRWRLPLAPRPPARSGTRPLRDRIAWAVAAAGRHLPGRTTCLARALAAELLLRRHGHPARLVIGVGRDGAEGFRAHAWVESTAQALLVPLLRLDPEGP